MRLQLLSQHMHTFECSQVLWWLLLLCQHMHSSICSADTVVLAAVALSAHAHLYLRLLSGHAGRCECNSDGEAAIGRYRSSQWCHCEAFVLLQNPHLESKLQGYFAGQLQLLAGSFTNCNLAKIHLLGESDCVHDGICMQWDEKTSSLQQEFQLMV